jgi:hypothetical protein
MTRVIAVTEVGAEPASCAAVKRRLSICPTAHWRHALGGAGAWHAGLESELRRFW